MKNTKKKIAILIAIIVVIAVIVCGVLYAMGKFDISGSAKERVYVEKVSNLSGAYSFAGNTYMGVVETQNTLSVPKASDREISKTYVKVGDHVNEGDILFEYTISDLKASAGQLIFDIQNAELDLGELNKQLQKAIEDRALIGTAKDPQVDSFGPYGYENLQSRFDEADNQIQALKISIEQKKNNIKSLYSQVDQANAKIENSTVTAKMSGVIKSVNDGTTGNSGGMGSDSNAYIVILAEGAYRVKGTVNEQNIYSVSVGMPVIVRSRVSKDVFWGGTISELSAKPEENNQSGGFYYGGDSSTQSSKYAFYIELDDPNANLLLGQHVYIEMAQQQEMTVDKTNGIWIPEYFIEFNEETGDPYVWIADSRMNLKKQPIEMGEFDANTFEYEITSGLTGDNYICCPTGSLSEGTKCVTNITELE